MSCFEGCVVKEKMFVEGGASRRLIGSGTSAANSAPAVYIGRSPDPQNPLPPTHVAGDHERIACTQNEPCQAVISLPNLKILKYAMRLQNRLLHTSHAAATAHLPKSIGTCACKHAIWASDIDTSPDPKLVTVSHGSLRSCSCRASRCPLANIVLANACGLL
jgi:hypothetical protein